VGALIGTRDIYDTFFLDAARRMHRHRRALDLGKNTGTRPYLSDGLRDFLIVDVPATAARKTSEIQAIPLPAMTSDAQCVPVSEHRRTV
jgi:hypothetical protein